MLDLQGLPSHVEGWRISVDVSTRRRLLDATEKAAQLGLHPDTVVKMARDGRIWAGEPTPLACVPRTPATALNAPERWRGLSLTVGCREWTGCRRPRDPQLSRRERRSRATT
jgi:hypothetical protein